MTAGDDDWPAVAGNLKKARKSWWRLSRILGREGATVRISGAFFKSVVQQVLLFGAETWVVTPRMERALSGFLHRAARRLTGRQARRGRNGTWHYPSLEGGHAGGRADGHRKIHREQAEHSRAVHCDATASGPVRGGQSEGGHKGATTVVEPDGHRLGGGKSKGRGRGDRQYQQIGVEHRGGGRPKLEKGRGEQGERFQRGGVEWSECRRVGVSQEE